MSDGRKAWTEEIEEEFFTKQLEKLKEKSYDYILDVLMEINYNLRALDYNNIPLTAIQRQRLENTSKLVKENLGITGSKY